MAIGEVSRMSAFFLIFKLVGMKGVGCLRHGWLERGRGQ